MDPEEKTELDDLEKPDQEPEDTGDDKPDSDVILQQLLEDPDIRSVVEAKRGGKQIVVKGVDEDDEDDEGDEAPTNPFDVDREDPDTMTNSELVKFVSGGMMKAVEGIVNKKLSGLAGDVEVAKSFIKSSQEKKVNDEVKDVSSRYSDLKTYSPEIQKLLKGIDKPNLEELYLIAKRRKLKSNPSREKMETERPDSSASRPSDREVKTDKKGRKGFNDLIQQALENLPDLGG